MLQAEQGPTNKATKILLSKPSITEVKAPDMRPVAERHNVLALADLDAGYEAFHQLMAMFVGG